jgi:hypothetical protein
MNQPTTAKEALLAEALGEMASLIERVEAVVPHVDESRKALILTGEVLSRKIANIEPEMKEFTGRAKQVTAKFIDSYLAEVTTKARETQTKAMQEAGHELFRKEFDPLVHRVVAHLQQLAQKQSTTWSALVTHAVAFFGGVVFATVMIAALGPR